MSSSGPTSNDIGFVISDSYPDRCFLLRGRRPDRRCGPHDLGLWAAGVMMFYAWVLRFSRWLFPGDIFGSAERQRQMVAGLRRRPPLPGHQDLLETDVYLNEWYPT